MPRGGKNGQEKDQHDGVPVIAKSLDYVEYMQQMHPYQKGVVYSKEQVIEMEAKKLRESDPNPNLSLASSYYTIPYLRMKTQAPEPSLHNAHNGKSVKKLGQMYSANVSQTVSPRQSQLSQHTQLPTISARRADDYFSPCNLRRSLNLREKLQKPVLNTNSSLKSI